MPTEPVPVRVTEIGEFIRFQSCERRFKLTLDNRRLARAIPFAHRLFNTLDPVLQEVGREAENRWELALREHDLHDLTDFSQREPGNRGTPWPEFRAALEGVAADTPAYGREIEIAGQLGGFQVNGRMDFVLVLWDRGTPRLRVVEAKASRKDRTYQRFQLAVYVLMLRQMVREAPFVTGCIATAHHRSRRLPSTHPTSAIIPIAMVYQVATKRGESSVQCMA